MKIFLFALIPLIFSIGIIPGFAESMSSQHDDSMGQHHMSYKGMCAPGFASLDEMCVLDDRCGPGIYAGKVCIMDGVMKQYLKPLQQKHAGISVENIICAEGKELMFKQRDATPACINSDSVEKLKTRGWQTELPNLPCTLEYMPVCGVDGISYGNMCQLTANHMAMKHEGQCMDSSVQTDVLYVDSKLVDCVGVGTQQCMLVKENIDSEWEMFYDGIEGFDYQEGTSYKLSVAITEIENPPADASSLQYDLVKILEKTQISQNIADLVFTNGIVYTVDETNLDADAVAIKNGIISFVGTNDDVQNYIGENTEVIDLQGKLMLPGMHDVHLHILEASSEFGGDCILNDSDPEEFVSYFQECSSEQTERDWLVGWGHSILSLEASQRTPLEIIDEAIPDRPAVMLEQTSHSAWANSKALELAGFDEDSLDPVAGILGRDGITGELNGILYENAGEIVMDLALTRTPDIDESNYQGLLFGLELLAENGITSITDAKVNLDRDFDDVWKRADAEDTLTVRAVMGIWTHPHHDDDYQIDRIKSLYSNDPDSLLKFTQVKMYSDGLLDSGTAKLVEPYFDDIGYGDDGKGINYFEEERIAHYITELEKVGFDFHIHALGDGAVRESLNAIESAQNANGNADTRHRLTHLELIHSDDINRFEELGVIADFQVAGDWTLPENNDYLEEVIGEERLAEQIPVRSVYDTGAVVTLSSDYDVSSISPFVGMQHALSREHQSMPDLESVIESYTINGVYLMRQDDKTGSIEVDKFADLIIVDQNIFEVPINKIGDTKVLFTYLEGEQVFP